MDHKAARALDEPSEESLRDIPPIDMTRARIIRRGPARSYRFTLQLLREATGKTQTELALAAGMAQGDVSRLERREDALVSSVRRYAAALGGKLELTVVIGDRRYVVDMGE